MRQHSSIIEQYFSSIIANAPFGVITISDEMEVGIINSDAIKLLGFPDQTPSDLIDTVYSNIFINIKELYSFFQSLFYHDGNNELDLSHVKSYGFTLNIKCRAILNGTLVILEDASRQAELEHKLQHQANHDPLTELVNRREFEERLQKFILRSTFRNLSGAVIFIDLDRFKPVNDSVGHAAGDELLCRITEILKSKIKVGDTLARIGGDEFAVLLEDCLLSDASNIAETMRLAIDEFIFVYDAQPFSIGISAGVAPINDRYDSVAVILNAADNACRIAKNAGRNKVHVINSDSCELEAYQIEVEWLARVNSALAANDFVLFQQKIEPLSGISGKTHYEILLRLKNKDGSLVLPSVFIPPAERYDRMALIDRWVLKEVFSQVSSRCEYSINLSGQSLSDDFLIDYIENLQKIYHVDPLQICFEITETVAIQKLDVTKKLINDLKSKGYRFSLDDFGSGLSSFAYLKNIPVDNLKIDGAFVKDIAIDPVSYSIVLSINQVAHTLGLKTIAEFVEDKAILEKLEEIGVDYVQGFYIHKPQPSEKAPDNKMANEPNLHSKCYKKGNNS